jgi:hypothetical protein
LLFSEAEDSADDPSDESLSTSRRENRQPIRSLTNRENNPQPNAAVFDIT